jgi:hypothetical protein
MGCGGLPLVGSDFASASRTRRRRQSHHNRIAARDNRGQSERMDPKFKRKLERAMNAAWSVAQEDGLSLDESVERIACYLLNHRDPEIRAFQQRNEEYAQRLRNQTRKDLH